MPTLLETIKTAWFKARFDASKGDQAATYAVAPLMMIVSEAQNKQRRSPIGTPWTDADTIGLVKSAVADAKLTLSILSDTDRVDDIARVTAEINVLSAYLPQQMSEQDIEDFVREKVAAGVVKMGDLMAALKAERGGQYDGKLASAVVKRVLG